MQNTIEIAFSTCSECPRSNGNDFCLEYSKILHVKGMRKEIPEWCEKKRFVYVKTRKVQDNVV